MSGAKENPENSGEQLQRGFAVKINYFNKEKVNDEKEKKKERKRKKNMKISPQTRKLFFQYQSVQGCFFFQRLQENLKKKGPEFCPKFTQRLPLLLSERKTEVFWKEISSFRQK